MAAEDGVVTLEVNGDALPTPQTPHDIARAFASQPLEEDWFMSLTLANGDVMEAYLDQVGAPFTLDVEVGTDVYLEAVSAVDDELLKQIFASFLAGDGNWRSMCKWEAPKPPDPKLARWESRKLWLLAIPVTLLLLAEFGQGRWAGALVLAALPFALAAAIVLKLREVKRASTWTPGTARIIRSELRTETRHGKEVSVPHVEYEFTVRFDKYRGQRISIGEIMPGTPEVQAAVNRYPVGGSAPVYYDPADPRTSVLERALPGKFGLVWLFVAVFAAACFAAAAWLVVP